MKNKLYDKLDFAIGYYGTFPAGFRGSKKPTIHFVEGTPEEIKSRAIKVWEEILKEAAEQRANGIFTDENMCLQIKTCKFVSGILIIFK